jgi:3-deoxy-D-manno-octulosonic-acid transferase
VPTVIGPNYSHFAELTALVNMGGCVSISTKKKIQETFKDLILMTSEKGDTYAAKLQ